MVLLGGNLKLINNLKYNLIKESTIRPPKTQPHTHPFPGMKFYQFCVVCSKVKIINPNNYLPVQRGGSLLSMQSYIIIKRDYKLPFIYHSIQTRVK